MKYIIYDLEATCWDGRPPGLVQETIEIGAYMLDSYGETLGSYNRFVKPILNPYLSPFCLNLTNIEQEAINRARKFPEVIEEFQEWVDIYDDYLLCSWGNFDRKLLVNDCKLHRLDFEWCLQHLDVKSQYQQMNKLNRPCSLKNALKREGLEFNGTPHRGIDDAENLAHLFIRYLGEWVE